MEDFGLLTAMPFTHGREVISNFTEKDGNFEKLFDALATGNIKETLQVCKSVGMSERQASLLVRDSAALAAFVLNYGQADSW